MTEKPRIWNGEEIHMTEAKVKRNYREECGPLAAKIDGLVLVPGMSPEGHLIGYTKQVDGSLIEWGTWISWRDAYHYLMGWHRREEEGEE